MKCDFCNNKIPDKQANYCPFCGKPIQKEKNKSYFGTYIGKDAVSFSCLIKTKLFNTSWFQANLKKLFKVLDLMVIEVSLIRKVQDSVSISEYPYICGHCEKYVVNMKTGRCGHCGAQHWVERESYIEAKNNEEPIFILEDPIIDLTKIKDNPVN